MSIAADAVSRQLDIGQALQDVLNVLLRNLGPLALLGVMLGGLPTALLYAGIYLTAQNPLFMLLGFMGLVASFVARPILYGAIVFRTVRGLDGEPATIGECLAAGRRRWGTLLGLMIWSGLLVLLGCVFLIVPGIFLALQWAVAGPRVVLSGRGISDSMDDSAALTKGRRWAVLLFSLVALVGLIVASLLLTLIEAPLSLVGPKLLATVLDTTLSNTLYDVFFPVVATVLYRRLRGEAQSGSTAALAEVFA